jgi:ABC-type Zn uptake system ZnuABC Zn-binding protein ZnuA
MKSFFVLLALVLPYIMGLSSTEAAQKISCAHPELCRLAKIILVENSITDFEIESVVKIIGDPHEFEPTSNEIKRLIEAQILISGPTQLNPWVRNTNYQRQLQSNKNIVTINLDITKEDFATYPSINREPLAHFWLYPKIFCSFKKTLEEQLFKNKILKVNTDVKSCNLQQEKITSELKTTLNSLRFPIILTHDALLPLLNIFIMNKKQVVSIRSSGHHSEASVKSVKNLYDVLEKSKAIWIIENNITISQNILSKKRSSDFSILIDTANSKNLEYFQILNELNEKLKATNL